jgi:chorismate mutase
MEQKYLLVDKSILPDYYEKVIEARAILASGKVKDVSEAVKTVGISRSTYYKYKDYVFALNMDTECHKAIVSFTLSHKAGVLGEVLKVIAENGANILTISQNLPINSRAHVVVTLDISHLAVDVNNLVASINGLDGATGTKLISVE